VGVAARSVTPSKWKVSGNPEQRSASIPSEVSNTTPPPASDLIIAVTRMSLPVFWSVRSSVKGLPTAAAIKADGLKSLPSRFFSSIPSGRPVTMALAGSIPSATPSKRSRLTPAGKCTLRVSLIRANPSRRSRSIDPEPRCGARYTVTDRAEGFSATVSAATAGAAASAQANAHPDACTLTRRLAAPRIR
jgi:hypothetical protein